LGMYPDLQAVLLDDLRWWPIGPILYWLILMATCIGTIGVIYLPFIIIGILRRMYCGWCDNYARSQRWWDR